MTDKHPLPTFKYHPDPLETGSIVESDEECLVCERLRGYIYTGPVFAKEELDECVCPWCISDGSAHEKFDAKFHDVSAIPGSSFPDSPQVDDSVIEEIAYRTPGFSAWQQEEWWTCCDDGAAFLGRAGFKELNDQWPGAISAIKDSTAMNDEDWTPFFQALDRDGSPTAYVFRCLHCGNYGGYQDCD